VSRWIRVSGSYLLDTNIVIALFNEDPAVRTQLEDNPEIYLPSVVLGELRFGAGQSARPDANEARIDSFSAACTIVVVDAETAKQYGRIKGALREKGRPIPDNDIWIGAIALQHGLVVASRDRHFEEIENLRVAAW